MPADSHRRRFSAGLFVVALALPASAQDPMTRVSVDASGLEANDYSYYSAVSGDGRYVAFDSVATNLIANDTNAAVDVFVRELATGAVVRVSVDSAGNEVFGFGSGAPAISDDGRYVAFVSFSDQLVSNDTNGLPDVFVRDRDPDGNRIFDEDNGVTTCVSVDSSGNVGNQGSGWADPYLSISSDGHRVAFSSDSTDLVASDTNAATDVFVHDLATGATERVSVDSSGNEADGVSSSPWISGDGTVVAFSSAATNLIPVDKNQRYDVFVHDLATGKTTRVNVDSSGTPARSGHSGAASLSHDGNFVAFVSYADDLVAGDTNGASDVFVRDRAAGTTVRASVDAAGAELRLGGYGRGISADGRFVVFGTASPLTPADVNLKVDVAVRDVVQGTTELVSSTCLGNGGDDHSDEPSISDDGSLVTFRSDATDLVDLDTNGVGDVFLFDRSVGWPRASWTNYDAGFAGTLGVPSLTASAAPRFGVDLTVDLSNSAGVASIAVVVVGLQRASIPTTAGGTLLVQPALFLPEALPAAGLSLPFSVPVDVAYCGVVLDLQGLELDAGAAHGVSFTPGLELVFGQ